MNGASARFRIAVAALFCAMDPAGASVQDVRLYDVSGLAWIAADSFLVVHDAKHPEENDRPRAGIIRLPDASSPLRYRSLAVDMPGQRPIHDLESIARIPGTPWFLLAESGDDDSSHERLYLTEFNAEGLRIREVADWPVAITNIEGMAVAQLGQTRIFIFAERAHGERKTELRWSVLKIDSLTFGPIQSVTFEMDVLPEPNLRPVSSLEVDDSGRIFAASASDPDVDSGPFRSTVWEIGSVEIGADGLPIVSVRRPARRLATLDALKVEAIAVRPIGEEAVELFVGTDDEHYGAVVRPLPGALKMREAREMRPDLKESPEK